MNKIALGILVVTVITMVGCRKEPVNNLTESESRIYITNHDSSINFASYTTYSIADSVAVIDGNQHGIQYNNTDAAFVNAIKANMQQLGYQQVPRSASPDLGLSVSRIISTSTGIINYNDYWNDYGSFYDPYYWGYSGYGYGYPAWGFAVYEIKEGLLSVDMVDLKNATANNNKVNVIWNGMIRGSGIFNSNVAANQVNQLFAQSPYISKNQ